MRRPAEACRSLFERANVAVGIENHDGRSTRQLADVLRAVDSPAVARVHRHGEFLRRVGGAVEVVINLGSFAKNSNLKDFQ